MSPKSFSLPIFSKTEGLHCICMMAKRKKKLFQTFKATSCSLFSSHVAPSQVAPCAWHREEDGSGLLPVSRPLISKEETLSRTRRRPAQCLSTTSYTMPLTAKQYTLRRASCTAPEHGDVFCVNANERTNQPTNVGEKLRNRGSFFPLAGCVCEA